MESFLLVVESKCFINIANGTSSPFKTNCLYAFRSVSEIRSQVALSTDLERYR